jgi:hypothetical protein
MNFSSCRFRPVASSAIEKECFVRKEPDISRVLFSIRRSVKRAVIYLGRLLPVASSGSSTGQEKDQPLPLPCFQPGFTEPAPLDAAGALLPHLCTLTSLGDCTQCSKLRRYVSVALSSRSPALGVTQQVWSLGSPDFPQHDDTSSRRNRLACSFPFLV